MNQAKGQNNMKGKKALIPFPLFVCNLYTSCKICILSKLSRNSIS
jgi:hypothetical protein